MNLWRMSRKLHSSLGCKIRMSQNLLVLIVKDYPQSSFRNFIYSESESMCPDEKQRIWGAALDFLNISSFDNGPSFFVHLKLLTRLDPRQVLDSYESNLTIQLFVLVQWYFSRLLRAYGRYCMLQITWSYITDVYKTAVVFFS